ncbi:6425_t:CDS:2, partial [Paraglomus occultum]
MAQAQDNGYRYIIHMRDHFTKFSWATAAKQKKAENVSKFLYDVFLMFGPPMILQCDNGKEFTGIMNKLEDLWPNLRIIHGRPRHPQSQGLVERGNAILKKKIAKWMETHKRTDWTSALGRVVYAMNCEVCRTTKFSPYQLVFGISPINDRVLLEELFEAGSMKEINAGNDVEIENITDDEIEDEEIEDNSTIIDDCDSINSFYQSCTDDAVATSNIDNDSDNMEVVREDNVSFSDSEEDIEENIFDGPRGEFSYKWDEFQQLLINVFGDQTEPPDVPRKYIADAIVEIGIIETNENHTPDSMLNWRAKLNDWLYVMSQMRITRKLNKGKKQSNPVPRPVTKFKGKNIEADFFSHPEYAIPWNQLRSMWIVYFGVQDGFPEGITVEEIRKALRNCERYEDNPGVNSEEMRKWKDKFSKWINMSTENCTQEESELDNSFSDNNSDEEAEAGHSKTPLTQHAKLRQIAERNTEKVRREIKERLLSKANVTKKDLQTGTI